jgi:hypothetical protein
LGHSLGVGHRFYGVLKVTIGLVKVSNRLVQVAYSKFLPYNQAGKSGDCYGDINLHLNKVYIIMIKLNSYHVYIINELKIIKF